MSQIISPHLNDVLKATSRAFYLSLRLLPENARQPLSLAYLIARAADTLADSQAAPESDRVGILKELQQSITTRSTRAALQERLGGFRPDHPGEVRLLEELPSLLELLDLLTDGLIGPTQRVLTTLIEGMVWDQRLFCDGENQGLDSEDLERYTYLVAGCVGPFWSDVCSYGDPRLSALDQTWEREVAVEFGKALQYTNILRDLPEDDQQGRHYLPPLTSREFPTTFIRVAHRGLDCFLAASAYPRFFPSTYFRHRLAVFLPLAIGLRTLELLFKDGGPRPGRRVKVSRREVFGWLIGGAVIVLSDTSLKTTLSKLEKRARNALEMVTPCN